MFLTVNLILAEIESRAIFLILSHPVRRADYLLRFLGTVAAVALGMAAMSLMHALLLSLYGWWEPGRYFAALACMFGKTTVMGALSLLLSLALTSEAAAMAFAVFLWMLGHFSSEMRFLADRSGSAFLKTTLVAFSHAAPDFARFNYRDFWHAIGSNRRLVDMGRDVHARLRDRVPGPLGPAVRAAGILDATRSSLPHSCRKGRRLMKRRWLAVAYRPVRPGAVCRIEHAPPL